MVSYIYINSRSSPKMKIKKQISSELKPSGIYGIYEVSQKTPGMGENICKLHF